MLVLLPIVVAAIQLPEVNLLARAHKVADVTEWAGDSSVPSYEWLADRKLIWYKERSQFNFIVNVLDTTTGESHSLDRVTKLLNHDGMGWPGVLKPSPDGTLLLGEWNFKFGTERFVADLRGQVKSAWPVPRQFNGPMGAWDETSGTYNTWLQDSKGILECITDRGKGDLLTSRIWTRKLDDFETRKSHGTVVLPKRTWWVAPKSLDMDHLVQVNFDGLTWSQSSATVQSWSLGDRFITKLGSVAFPGENLQNAAISSEAKLLLWRTDSNVHLTEWPPARQATQSKTKSEEHIALWVTQLNGGRRRLLGKLMVHRDELEGGWPSFGGERFLPGGKQVSFVYRNGLYIIDL